MANSTVSTLMRKQGLIDNQAKNELIVKVTIESDSNIPVNQLIVTSQLNASQKLLHKFHANKTENKVKLSQLLPLSICIFHFAQTRDACEASNCMQSKHHRLELL